MRLSETGFSSGTVIAMHNRLRRYEIITNNKGETFRNKSTVLLIAAAVLLSSCGTAVQTASSGNGQRYQDGIYSSAPSFRSRTEKAEEKAETEALVEKTKASQIYLFGDRKDTVMIPDNMAATIKYDREARSTVVSVYENPYDWRNNIMDPWDFYTPYSIGSSWYWSRHYNPWYYTGAWGRPYWRYSSWYYDPWYYGGWYDPWYYGGWYDPWYYGYAGFWDPWYYMHPHYAGWYGGWYDPYWGHHHHHHGPGHGPSHKPDDNHGPRVYTGTRHSTGSDRVFARSSSLRGGSSVSSRPINRSTASSGSAVTSRPAAGKNGITRTSSAIRDRQTAASKNPATVTSRPSSGRTATVTRTAPGGRTGTAVRPSGSSSQSRTATVNRQSNHRRPAVTSPGTSSGSSSTYNRGFSSQSSENRSTSTGQSYRSSRSENTYNRSNSQAYERSSSQSYNRSSGVSSYNRSSGSTATRSTGGGGGGFSRSGGSSGGGMRR